MARPELYGRALDDYLRKASKHFGNMTAFCEETSVEESRIELDATRKDAYQLPAAKVIHEIPEENAVRLELAKTEGLEIFRAAGASAVWASGRNAVHLMGGTLMGDEPNSSVTNSYGQTHEVENLFLAGASLFPTSAAVNPTATLASLALRTADYLREHRSAAVP
ncbi:MAG TPA: GMC oxidoreductase [Vicinamibacteria bacterium]|nr:GMC oxidoreductase [Vicinamibacteria bacterium]